MNNHPYKNYDLTKEPCVTEVVRSFLDQGYSVCYIDADDTRRALVRGIELDRNKLETLPPILYAGCLLHYSVVIAVNEHEFEKGFKKGWRNIPGVIDNKKQCIVRIEI